MTDLTALRSDIRAAHRAPEAEVLSSLIAQTGFDKDRRVSSSKMAAELVTQIRQGGQTGLMEVFLAEYGLSTDEGIALMCLAEALLRVPDTFSIDELIEDKIAPSDWSEHLGRSSSPLVNASTWALLLTGQVLKEGTGLTAALRGAIKRLGEPVIRTAVGRAMKELGAQFVLGQTISSALKRGAGKADQGYTFSFDMLGEAAMTARDADAFFAAYAAAIQQLGDNCKSDDIRENPGISIKLSALHPRYEQPQMARVMDELVPRVRELARMAKSAGMGLNIDAEEAERLDLSLDVIEAVLADRKLARWDGFGVVVQAYSKRAPAVLKWLYALALGLDRKIMVRLVKGAYWDSEIKRAQVEGVAEFPVFTRKSSTDMAYICCAEMLLAMTDRVYPQFATHNAHSVAAILELAGKRRDFEFQRLHGMGESLHDQVMDRHGTRCRIYAPVGAHRDLLAYLVRRLLENGANSSFVNQIVDETIPPAVVGADPFAEPFEPDARIARPADIFLPSRQNSRGWDLHDRADIAAYQSAREAFRRHQWKAAPLIVPEGDGGVQHGVLNPANASDVVGEVTRIRDQDVSAAIDAASPWRADVGERAQVLMRAADLYEDHAGEFFALVCREAGKTPVDAVAELREAVDFLRYYAERAKELEAPARGLVACISPWNFPLAIFTGQIAAALAAGNGVLAKPAEATTLTAHLSVGLMHQAGLPVASLQLLPGPGSVVGAALSSAATVAGMCFTGSTATALRINRAMAENLSPAAPLIAETGGLNAMIVDSTALPEQAIADIVNSAFRSAGQRCSALRMLYLQEDVAKPFLRMLYGAMDELTLGDPWDFATDVGPVIDESAKARIDAHIAEAQADKRVLKRLDEPAHGHFVAPVAISVAGIEEMAEEIFGPVLHVATYKAEDIDQVVDRINASGYGLTFGIHSRIDGRIEQVIRRVRAGNIYVNRNQIGAIVGSQPFGGVGLSGTGPKAGGPNYVARFAAAAREPIAAAAGEFVVSEAVQSRIDAAKGSGEGRVATISLPGPTGESNRLSKYGRGVILCLGPDAASARDQAAAARASGAAPVLVAPGLAPNEGLDGRLSPQSLADLNGVDAVVHYGEDATLAPYRRALAGRDGVIVPLIAERDLARLLRIERHVCVDTTAAGGNAALLAAVS